MIRVERLTREFLHKWPCFIEADISNVCHSAGTVEVMVRCDMQTITATGFSLEDCYERLNQSLRKKLMQPIAGGE